MLAGAELPLLRRGAHLTNGKPSGGVSEARVAGRDIELIRGCTEESEHTILVEEARRLVEDEGVDAVVGAIGESDSLVFRELARKYPDVIFISVWSGAQGLTLRHPAAQRLSLRHRRSSGRGGAWQLCLPRTGMAPRRGRRRHDTRRVAGGSRLRRGVLRPRRGRDSALHGADRPRRPEGRPRSPGRRRRRRADVRRALRARRLSARARPASSARPRPGLVAGTYVLEDSNALVPIARGLRRGGRRVVDPAGKRNTRDARLSGQRIHEGISRAAALGCGDTARVGLQRRHGGPAAGARGLEWRPVGWSSTAARGARASGLRRSIGPCAPRPEPPGSPEHLPGAYRSRRGPSGRSSS